MFIKKLNLIEESSGRIDCIANTGERYISFSKKIRVDTKVDKNGKKFELDDEIIGINPSNSGKFKNQCTFIINIGDKIVNSKLFKNGTLVLVGCKSLEDGILAINIIKHKLSDNSPTKLDIRLINSVTSCGYSINRDYLLKLMNNQPEVAHCNFDKNKYSGVIIVYRTMEKYVSHDA